MNLKYKGDSMKKLLILASMFTVQLASAGILNSALEVRHQNLIEKAITENCGSMFNLTELAVTAERIRVDNGITDVKYVSVLTGEQVMDQNIVDTFTITVKSEYGDFYDHSTQNWGAYTVSSVSCVMK